MDALAQSAALLDEFCEEAMEQLQGLPATLTDYARAPGDSEPINIMFRAVHTIKGNAGFFGLPAVRGFAHSLEDALDDLRQGKISLNDELTRSLVEGLDALTAMVAQVQHHKKDAESAPQNTDLLDRIRRLRIQPTCDSPEQRVLAQVLELADEIAASGSLQGADWSRRLREFVAGADRDDRARPTGSQSGYSDAEAKPATLAKCHFQAAGEDVTEMVRSLLELFLSVERGDYERRLGEAFLGSIDGGESLRRRAVFAAAVVAW